MYATFKMSLQDIKSEISNEFYKKGLEIFKGNKKIAKDSLEEFLSADGELQASEIEKEFFPSIEADVFISHSHKDEESIIAFAGYLDSLGIKAFVDSCIWGYSNDLLREIDNEYCVSSRNENGSIATYDYQKRNRSTSHVHIILNSALMKMMDKTECLIFIDSPNSLKTSDITSDIKQGTTNSEWIYSELLMTQYLRRIKLERMHIRSEFSESVAYDVDISHMKELTIRDLKDERIDLYGTDILDHIYRKKGIH